MKLAGWISDYYCAPLGETLRAIGPLSGEVRHSKVFLLTPAGRDTARQLHLVTGDADDPASLILKLLDGRPLSASYIQKKVKDAAPALRSLIKKGFIEVEDTAQERDPLRASSGRLRAEFVSRTEEKLPKPERELLAYLELHPGLHNLKKLEDSVAKASASARSLGRRQLIRLTIEPIGMASAPPRAPHELNPHQRGAFQALHSALSAGAFQAFLLEGVTGSGKTEIYLNAIDSALALGR